MRRRRRRRRRRFVAAVGRMRRMDKGEDNEMGLQRGMNAKRAISEQRNARLTGVRWRTSG